MTRRQTIAILLSAVLLTVGLTTAAAAIGTSPWQMHQRDMYKTGRADYVVPAERMNDTFFNFFLWQKPAPDSPGNGHLDSAAMVFFDGAGPGMTDLVVGAYHWPKGVQGMDRHTGELFWYGNPAGGETIARSTPAFSNDGATLYVVNDATASDTWPDGHPLMAFDSAAGPATFRHNGDSYEPSWLEQFSPVVGPDDRIYLHEWWGPPAAGVDDGMGIEVDWLAVDDFHITTSDVSLYDGLEELVVIITTDDGRVTCCDGLYGDTMWSEDSDGPIYASPTIDPETGNIYVAAGDSHTWVKGYDIDGVPLWSSASLRVYEHIPGTNNPHRAQSAGCLSWDGATYYFQTSSNEGDGLLYAIETADGSVKWTCATGSTGWDIRSSSPIVTRNDVIVVGNNHGDTYFAIEDTGAAGVLLDTYDVNPDDHWDGRAVSSATLSGDGQLYLPLRTLWTAGNGDGDTPSADVANLFSAFDLTEDAVASLPVPANQMAFALNNSVQVLWDEIADPGDAFDHYAIYRDTAAFADVGGKTPVATVDNIALTAHLDDTAANGTAYWYAVTTVTGDGGEATAVASIGPRTPREAYDVQVVSISREARYPRYCPEYTVHEITEPGGFGPYYCSAATGLGCGQDETTRRWPEIGETVTFTATIRNRGTETMYETFDAEWTLDGAPLASDGEMLFLAPNDTATFETTLVWDGLDHEIAFALDFTDDREANNSLAIGTRSVAYFSCIERSRLEVFREDTANWPNATTDDFIDWLNNHMARLNEMFAEAGCAKRVHYDLLPVIDDGAGDPAVENIEFAIFPLRYAAADGSLRTSGYYHADSDLDFGLLHEWSHQLGLIDLYQINLDAGQNLVSGESYRTSFGLMHGCQTFFSEHSANAMNLWLDRAHGYYGQYLYSLPEHVTLRFVDQAGQPLRAARVRVYQMAERPGQGKVIADQVKFEGWTDALGEYTLPNVAIDPLLVPPALTGDVLNDNPFGYVHVVGTNGLLLLETELDGIVNYNWLDIVEVNNAFWAGQTGTALFEREVGFGDHMFSLPDELTELNAADWSGHCENDGETILHDDETRTVAGDASLRYETTGAFDTWMRYPGSGEARWNMETLTGFEFSVWAENDNDYGFQNHSPWIILNCVGGSYEYHAASEILNDHLGQWLHCAVPLAGDDDWSLAVAGAPDLSRVRSIEFHADTWGDGFTLWVDGLAFNGLSVAVPDGPEAPARTRLLQNSPNPFNPTTTIKYDLARAGRVSLRVYDAAGRLVRTLCDGEQTAGRREVIWDGRDDGGKAVVSGLYFYRLDADGAAATRKMLLLK